MPTKKIECNLCGSGNYNVVYKKTGEGEGLSKILRCNSCGLVFAEMDKDLLSCIDKYACMVDEEYIAEEKGWREASAKVLKRIERYKRGRKILDVGCATGFFLDEARRRKWEIYGVEASEWAAKYAIEKLNLNVKKGTLKDAAYPDQFFDVVVMLDMLEHLPDPKDTLLEIRRILKNDGILYISAPNMTSAMSRILRAKWWGIKRFYLYYFTKMTFARMLDACGFKVKRFNPHIRVFSIKYWVKRLRPLSFMLYKMLDFISRIDNLGNIYLKINFHDTLEAAVVKARKLDYLVSSLTAKKEKDVKKDMRVFVVLPAYNAEETLERTVADIPKDVVEKIILVDDNSVDKTAEIANRLGLEVIRHNKNMGYGANQKSCYKKALEEGADIVVMVHPDYQYDPTVIPSLIEPIQKGEADAVFGSRMMKGGALMGGMPLWKHNVNIVLTAFENIVLGTYLTEVHSGFRAYSADLLRTVNFELNSNKFVFDTEIIVQTLMHHFKIEETPIQTRYFDEASKITLGAGLRYGLSIIWTMVKYVLHIKGIYKFKQFE